MHVVVTGSRHWSDKDIIKRCIAALRPSTVHVGDATGADALAVAACIELSIPYKVYKANWSYRGRGGTLRNEIMIDTAMTDAARDNSSIIVLAYPLPDSKGTVRCMEYAATQNLTIINYGRREN